MVGDLHKAWTTIILMASGSQKPYCRVSNSKNDPPTPSQSQQPQVPVRVNFSVQKHILLLPHSLQSCFLLGLAPSRPRTTHDNIMGCSRGKLAGGGFSGPIGATYLCSVVKGAPETLGTSCPSKGPRQRPIVY